MTIKFYLDKNAAWAEIWDSIRVWIEQGYNSRFGQEEILPRSFAQAEGEFAADGDTVRIEKRTDEVSIVYVKHAEGRMWTTRLYLKRTAKSVYCEVTGSCDDPAAVISRPKIVGILVTRFHGLNVTVAPERPVIIVQNSGTRNENGDREDAIAFIRTLYKRRKGCESWPKTVGYVRYLRDETNLDYRKCAAIQAYIKSVAKKEVTGEDKAWNSLAQQVKPSHGRVKKSERLGPIPILDKGTDYL